MLSCTKAEHVAVLAVCRKGKTMYPKGNRVDTDARTSRNKNRRYKNVVQKEYVKSFRMKVRRPKSEQTVLDKSIINKTLQVKQKLNCNGSLGPLEI